MANINTTKGLQEAMAASQGLTFYTLIGNLHEGVIYGNFWEGEAEEFTDPFGKLEDVVRNIRSRGLSPKLRQDQTTIKGQTTKVVLCSRRFFLGSATEGRGMEEVFVIFRKPLTQVFIDIDEMGLDEVGVPKAKQEAAIKLIDANEAKGIPTPLSAITSPQLFHPRLSGQSCWVTDIKPNEITRIIAATIDNDYKTPRTL